MGKDATPRLYTEAEVSALWAPLLSKIEALKRRIAQIGEELAYLFQAAIERHHQARKWRLGFRGA